MNGLTDDQMIAQFWMHAASVFVWDSEHPDFHSNFYLWSVFQPYLNPALPGS